MHGLDWYEYGARYNEPVLSRFTTMDPLAEKYYSISPYAYCAGNPLMFVDPDGRVIESIWDIASLVTGVVSFKSNIQQGNIGDAVVDGIGIVADGIALALPAVPGGVGAGIKAARVADKAVDAKKSTILTKNVAKGKAFEKQVGESLSDIKASQVTIEAPDGTRTRVDFVQKKEGKVVLIEAKGSETAPLTPNQKKAHPQIQQSGGIVKSNNGNSIGLPSGKKIPPTKIEIIRPNNLENR